MKGYENMDEAVKINEEVNMVTETIWKVIRNQTGPESLTIDRFTQFLSLILLYADGYITASNLKKVKLFVKGKVTEREFLVAPVANDLLRNSPNLPNHAAYFQLFNDSHWTFLQPLREEEEALLEILLEIDTVFLGKNTGVITDNLIRYFNTNAGKGVGLFSTPPAIVHLMCALADVRSGEKIFNPFAGPASFASQLPSGTEYLGQEINRSVWILGKLCNIAHRSPTHFDYRCEDTIRHWPEDKRFDVILSNPPFNARITSEQSRYRNKTSDEFVLSEGPNLLVSGGRMVLVLPMNFLFAGGRISLIRQELLDNNRITDVITLPGGLYAATPISVAVVVIGLPRSAESMIRMVDATDYASGQSYRDRSLDTSRLLKDLKYGGETAAIRFVSRQDVEQQDNILHPLRYLGEEVEGEMLSSILMSLNGERAQLPDGVAGIRIADLRPEDDLSVDLPLNDEGRSNRSQRRSPSVRAVASSCLLVALSGRNLRPTLFRYTGTQIYLTPGVKAFTFDESRIDPEYLIQELRKPFVIDQVNRYRSGTSIDSIRSRDFLRIKINLPELRDQRVKMQALREVAEQIAHLKTAQSEIAEGVLETEFSEFASLKHTLGTPLGNSSSWIGTLIRYWNRHPLETAALDASFRESYQQDMGIKEVLEQVGKNLQFVGDLLNRAEKGLILSEYPLESISVSKVNELLKGVARGESRFSVTFVPLTGAGLKNSAVLANATLLKVLLVNILDNAWKHGFNRQSKGHSATIDLTSVDDRLIIGVSNNGKPFPKGIGREQFIEKFTTADLDDGTGLGGYDVERIARYFGVATWAMYPGPPVSDMVRFTFDFHLNNNA